MINGVRKNKGFSEGGKMLALKKRNGWERETIMSACFEMTLTGT